jgi:hypothetical protein
VYLTLRRLYLAGSLSDAGLDSAVTKRYITQAQADQIRADKAAQDAADQAILDSLMGTTTEAPQQS